MTSRYVVVALARNHQGPLAEVSRWATNGRVPVELVKCLSVDEVDAVFGSGRRVSALLVDAGSMGADRDVVGRADEIGAATLVVDDGRTLRDWDALGVAEVLPAQFGPERLVDALVRHCEPVDGPGTVSARAVFESPVPACSAAVVAVTGSGGAGSSTVAAAVAQCLGDREQLRADDTPSVVLVDAASRGDQAMYHDVGDVIPGLPELVDAVRVDELDPTELAEFLFDVAPRPYRLLLGARRPREWVTLGPRTIAATLGLLARHHQAVVVDHDRELDGEAETGSVDVEELHGRARTAVAMADLVLAVGLPGAKGTHDLVRLLDELTDADVPGERLLPVVNRAPRSPAGRSAITAALGALATRPPVEPPVFVPTVRRLEDHHRGARRFPAAMTRPLGRRVLRTLSTNGPRQHLERIQPVRTGELGTVGAHDGAEVA